MEDVEEKKEPLENYSGGPLKKLTGTAKRCELCGEKCFVVNSDDLPYLATICCVCSRPESCNLCDNRQEKRRTVTTVKEMEAASALEELHTKPRGLKEVREDLEFQQELRRRLNVEMTTIDSRLAMLRLREQQMLRDMPEKENFFDGIPQQNWIHYLAMDNPSDGNWSAMVKKIECEHLRERPQMSKEQGEHRRRLVEMRMLYQRLATLVQGEDQTGEKGMVYQLLLMSVWAENQMLRDMPKKENFCDRVVGVAALIREALNGN